MVGVSRETREARTHYTMSQHTFAKCSTQCWRLSYQLTRVWQADTAEDGGSRQVWLARVVVWQGMRAPGRRVCLCRRSTRLGAPVEAPSHPVLAVRPSCGLLKRNTTVFVSHGHCCVKISVTAVPVCSNPSELWPQ